MTAPVVHAVSVVSSHNHPYPHRAVCACGWKSARYSRLSLAELRMNAHRHAVAAGEWRQAGAR